MESESLGLARRAWLVGPALILLASPLLILVIAAVIFGVVEACYAIARGDDMRPSRFVFETTQAAQLRIDWPAHALSVIAIVLCASVVAVIGRQLGRRFPLVVTHRGAHPLTGPAMVAPVLVAIGGTLLWLGTSADLLRSRTIAGSAGPDYLSGTLLWIIAAMTAGWWLARHRMTWPRIALMAVAATGLAVTVAGIRSAGAVGLSLGTAPAWFPLSLLSPDGWAAPDQALTALAAVSSQLFDGSALALLCSCFVLAYGAGAVDRTSAQPAPPVLSSENSPLLSSETQVA